MQSVNRNTHRHRNTHTDTETHTQTQKHTHTDTETHTDTDTETHTHTDTGTHTHTDTENNGSRAGNHMEASFFQNQQKAWAFEGKGFLNNYVFFFMNDKEPPLMIDEILTYVAPHKSSKKKFRKKMKVKN